MRLLLAAVLVILAGVATLAGCGEPPPSRESSWREEVDGSLKALEAAASFRYHLALETWIGVSGQSVYGDERGDGSYADGDFSVQLSRTSPAGAEALAIASHKGQPYLQEEGQWRPVSAFEMPSPLDDPLRFPALASGYANITFEGEESRGGLDCRRYLLQLDSGRARDAVGDRTWSYFSHLRYELNCRVWVGDPSAPPLSLQLEIVGFDPEESAQRYRLLATLDPYDAGAPDIQVNVPETPPAT
jgi:hypothetical protein